MTYEVIVLNDYELEHWQGKIIEVLKKERRAIRFGYDKHGNEVLKLCWQLTLLVEKQCLEREVEVDEKEKNHF